MLDAKRAMEAAIAIVYPSLSAEVRFDCPLIRNVTWHSLYVVLQFFTLLPVLAPHTSYTILTLHICLYLAS